MKKIVLLVLALLLVILPASAARYETEGDFGYNLREDGTACIERYFGTKSTVVVPSEIGGVPVTEIDWLGQQEYITEVVIPETVIYMNTSIDESDTAMDELKFMANPFASLDSLASIVVDENNPVLEVIDGVLFTKLDRSLVCYPKARVDENGEIVNAYSIPEGTISIARDALRGAPFSQVSFPSTLVSVSMQAFCECKNLKRVELPESVTELSKSVFSDCRSLTEAILSENITVLPYGTFSGCRALESVRFSTGLTEVGKAAFKNCGALTDVVWPDTLITIGEAAFEGCASQP